jgi:hypothetical protein
MDISSIISAMESEKIEALYAVKLIKMAQQADEIVATLLEDTAEISEEAMAMFMSEKI